MTTARTLTTMLTAAATAVAGLAFAAPAQPSPTPVKCADGDVTVDGRVFPEPRLSASYLGFDEFSCGIAYLAENHPDRLDVEIIATSADGHPVYDVVLTDETVPAAGKDELLMISSIHGNEIGAREGAARHLEDLVDDRFLAGTDWVEQLLDDYAVHWVFPNPDGWVNGDTTGNDQADLVYTRGNATGLDLNRNYPVAGWIEPAHEPLSQPESRGVDALLNDDDHDWYLGTDNHGQGGDSYLAAGLQIVGQFDYGKSETLARFADRITEEMANYEVHGTLETLGEQTGEDLGTYHWGTLYDMLGYSASGSLIDYYNTAATFDGFGFATELTAGQQFNRYGYVPELNQAYVDSIRAINTAMFKQALAANDYTFEVGGDVAYVFDPQRVTSDDANGAGHTGTPGLVERYGQADYDVSRMAFFDDLDEFASRPLTSVTVGGILDGSADLSAFDSLVLANDAMPGAGDWAAYVDRIEAFVRAGGNLVVTDAAAPVLADLGVVAADAIRVEHHPVGSVQEFTDRSHPLNEGLRGVASQTYDVVPIGYVSNGDTAPNWVVDRAAWEEAGGFTAGIHGDGETIYGQVPLGHGRIRFLGALLPDPTEDYYHPFGLQSYAVTYTGYTLLANMLDTCRSAASPAPPAGNGSHTVSLCVRAVDSTTR